jgi:hypothetical protein
MWLAGFWLVASATCSRCIRRRSQMMADGHPSLHGIFWSEFMIWLLSSVVLVKAIKATRSGGAEASFMKVNIDLHEGVLQLTTSACWKGCCKLSSAAAALLCGSAVLARTRGFALCSRSPLLSRLMHALGGLIRPAGGAVCCCQLAACWT